MSESVPLAEHFHSIQGEGTHVGIPMHFIRLAGCSVGRAQGDSPLPIIYNRDGSRAFECATYDGRTFWCDTNYNAHERVPVATLLDETWEGWICLTGGEPLTHYRRDYFHTLLEGAHKKGIRVHLETSGTIWPPSLRNEIDWITVAPKKGYLEECIEAADELKLLVDETFDITRVPASFLRHPNLFFCPINSETEVNLTNVQRCLDLLKTHPSARLSCQWHKFLGVR